MEPLENRIARLTPEQRKEVEDFVDFLLLKNTLRQEPAAVTAAPPLMMTTPPVLSAEPIPAASQLPHMQDLVQQDKPQIPDIHGEEQVPAPVHDGTGGGDWITRDYMDYGLFEKQPSPATEAVKKVKQKIISRQADEKPSHLLEWVD